MDRIMGLAGETGKAPALKAEQNRFRKEDLLSEIHELRDLFAVTIREAAKMVCRRVESADPEGWKDWGVKPYTLAQNYERSPLGSEFMAMIKELEPRGVAPEEHLREYLQQYPPDCIPKRLRFLRMPARHC